MIFTNHVKLTTEIAKNLYLGIVADTGRFMHAYTTKETFKLVTKLLYKTNLNFTDLYEPLYMRPLSEIKFQGYIFKNMKITENGLAYIKITDELLKEYDVDAATPGNMINSYNYINEMLVWVTATLDKELGSYRISIRSRGPIINEVAAQHGGGGHIYASGVRLKTEEEIKKLVEDLNKVTKEYMKNL